MSLDYKTGITWYCTPNPCAWLVLSDADKEAASTAKGASNNKETVAAMSAAENEVANINIETATKEAATPEKKPPDTEKEVVAAAENDIAIVTSSANEEEIATKAAAIKYYHGICIKADMIDKNFKEEEFEHMC